MPRNAVVPIPTTILSHIPANASVFTIVDLQHAFFAIPLHSDSQYLFAFTFEGTQYTWTRLPQGFVHSPTIFPQVLKTHLQNMQLTGGSAIIQDIDDLILASPSAETNEQDTRTLLLTLHSLGYVIPKRKVKSNQSSDLLLGVTISATERSLTQTRLTSIMQFEPPTTPKDMRAFLGLVNF